VYFIFINMPLINQLVLHPFIFTLPANSQYTFFLFLWICLHDCSPWLLSPRLPWLCHPPVITRLRPSQLKPFSDQVVDHFCKFSNVCNCMVTTPRYSSTSRSCILRHCKAMPLLVEMEEG